MKTEINCIGCNGKLRVPAIGEGKIVCPHCSYSFTISSGKAISSNPNEKKGRSNEGIEILLMGLMFIAFFAFTPLKNMAVDWYQDKAKNGDEPYLEMLNNEVHVYNMYYNIGLVGVNEVSTNMSEFDELAWDKLRNKHGLHKIVMHNKSKNKYGNIEVSIQEVGILNLNELNKYQSFEDFEKDGGFYTLIEKD